jgi:predicted acetyltransferase
MAADPAAGTALWRDVLSRDLVTEVRVQRRPADDPLQFQLADSRRVRAREADGLWVRLVDEHRPGPLTRLSAAMSWDPSPWCPGTF